MDVRGSQDSTSPRGAAPEVTLQASPTSGSLRPELVAPDTPSHARRRKLVEQETLQRLERRLATPRHESSTETAEDLLPRCLICMNLFTDREPSFKIPCSARCNDSPVHERCVYEWKERQPTGQGTCPLCRADLLEMNYVPADLLGSASFACFAARKEFILKPVPPQIGFVRCYVRVTKSTATGGPTMFDVFLQAPSTLPYPLGPLPRADQPAPGDRLLLQAKKRFVGIGKGQIDVSMDGTNFDRDDKYLVGAVASSFTGLEHTILAVGASSENALGNVATQGTEGSDFGHHSSMSSTSVQGMREVACVHYVQNRFGRGVGPRQMRVAIPAVVPQDDPPPDFSDEEGWSPRFEVPLEENPMANRGKPGHVRYATAARPAPRGKSETLSHHLRRFYGFKDADPDRIPALYRDPEGGLKLNCFDPVTQLAMGRNQEPYWLEILKAYSLDFRGRVTLPSNKNFILMLPSESRPAGSAKPPPLAMDVSGDSENETAPSDGSFVALQFGKVESVLSETYTLDVAFPLSVLQAVGIALTACDRKLGCA